MNTNTSVQPSLSIVTPSFNQGQFIEETIRSVMNQRAPSVEHIVVDGGSTDDTLSVLRRFEHLDWTSEKDRGQTDAVNKGLRKARGRILGWINSDDVFLEGAFEAVLGAFDADPDCSVVFGDYHAVEADGRLLYSTEGFCGTYDEMVRWWDYTYAIHQPTVFVRRSVLEKVGFLDESFTYAMDYEWWLRIARHYAFVHVPRALATYRMHRDAKTFAPLEEFVYPEQLRASKRHWGPVWGPRYWRYRRSYQAYLKRKPARTLHNPALEQWHDTQNTSA